MPKADFPRTNPLGDQFNPFDTGVQATLNRVAMIAYRFAVLEEGLTSLLARPIPREHPAPSQFMAIIGSSTSVGTNKWEYEWEEAQLTSTFDDYEIDPLGRKWDDVGNTKARNLVEQLNTASSAVHGHVVGPGPPADVTVKAIPQGTPTPLTFEAVTDNTRRYFFREPNALDVICTALSSQSVDESLATL